MLSRTFSKFIRPVVFRNLSAASLACTQRLYTIQQEPNVKQKQHPKRNFFTKTTIAVALLAAGAYSTYKYAEYKKSSVEDKHVLLRSKDPKLGYEIQIAMGDLTKESTDAIVNAANEHLRHGGGVARAIVKAGGEVIQEESNEWVRKNGPVPTGETAITGAGSLNCKYVIHTVGPRWKDGKSNEDQLLMNAIYNSLKRADEYQLKSISIPAVSSGIFGFPKDRCAKILIETAERYMNENPQSGLKVIRFINFDQPTVDEFVKAFNVWKTYK